MDGHRRHDAPTGPGGDFSRRAVLRGVGGAGLAALFAARWAPAAAQDATPAAMAGHPVVGAWRWTNNPGTEHEFFSFAIFVADGTYVETAEDSFVIVGEWRATGERTAELVIVPNQKVSLDALFEPGAAIPEDLFQADPAGLYRISIEVDAGGDRFAAEGEFEEQDASGAVIGSSAYAGVGDRMALVAGAATPAP